MLVAVCIEIAHPGQHTAVEPTSEHVPRITLCQKISLSNLLRAVKMEFFIYAANRRDAVHKKNADNSNCEKISEFKKPQICFAERKK